MPKKKKPTAKAAPRSGPPRAITPAIADQIIDLISTGHSVLEISKRPGMPARATIVRWCADNPAVYDLAREARGDCHADEILSICDEPLDYTAPQHVIDAELAMRRFRVETRKWAASRMAPRRWGDKLHVDQRVGNPDGSPLAANAPPPPVMHVHFMDKLPDQSPVASAAS